MPVSDVEEQFSGPRVNQPRMLEVVLIRQRRGDLVHIEACPGRERP